MLSMLEGRGIEAHSSFFEKHHERVVQIHNYRQPYRHDQMKLLAVDNVVSPEAIAEQRTLEGLGIHPEAIESIVPAYLTRFRKAGQFEPQKAA